VSPSDSAVPANEAEALAALDELMELPSAEAEIPKYEGLASDLRSALDDHLGPVAWETPPTTLVSGMACAEQFSTFEGRSIYVESRAQAGEVAGGDWDAALDIVRDVALEHGFDGSIPVADQGDVRQVVLTAERDATITIYLNTTFGISIESGCYLKDVDRASTEQFGVPDPDRWALLFPDSTEIPAP